MTNNYKKILIAQNCSLSFDSQVGLFLTEPVCQLVGEVFLYKLKGKIFADITSEIDANDYYPKILFMGNKIDSILLDKVEGRQPIIRKIGEQILLNQV